MNIEQRLYGIRVAIIGTLDTRDEIVFHRRATHERDDDPKPNEPGQTTRGWVSKSACGRVLDRYWWRELNGKTVDNSQHTYDRATNVHITHAIRFARPCRQCWRQQPIELIDRAVA